MIGGATPGTSGIALPAAMMMSGISSLLLSYIPRILLAVIWIAGLFYGFRAFRSWYRVWKTLRPVPGPSDTFPFFFTIQQYFSCLGANSKECGPTVIMFQSLMGLCETYKQQGLFKIYIGWKPIVILYSPEKVEHILSSNTNIKKSFLYDHLHPWLGAGGLITSYGEHWRVHRKLLTPAFHFRILENFLPIVNEQADVLVEQLSYIVDQDNVKVYNYVSKCTLDVICETAMGVKVSAQTDTKCSYEKALVAMGYLFILRCFRPWMWPNSIYFRTTEGAWLNKVVHELHSFTKKVIKKKKEEFLQKKEMIDEILEQQLNGKCSLNSKRRLAFLDLLMAHHVKDGSLSEEDIRQEVDTFMFAGHDTAAQAISWALYLLGLHPEIQQKVHEEIDKVFVDDPDRNVTTDDLRELKYVECVFKETLRLFPSAPWIGRNVTEDMTIENYDIPKGSICYVFIYGLHRNEKHFSDPETFNPDRFLPENCNNRHPYAYVPFSAGPRNCIGQRYAMMESKIIITKVLRKYRLTSTEYRDRLKISGELLIRTKGGVKVTFHRRKP